MQYYKRKAEDEKLKNKFTKAYLQKETKGGLKPTMLSKYKSNIAIFDFDDTLYPTSWTNQKSISSTREIIGKLDDINDAMIKKILKMKFNVYIITNGSSNWVADALLEMPKLEYLILSNQVQLISGFDLYAHKYENPSTWKVFSFYGVIKGLKKKPKTIISVGDSPHDMYSAWMFAKNVKYVQTMRYKEKSTAKQMIKQAGCIIKRLESYSDRNMHIELKKFI